MGSEALLVSRVAINNGMLDDELDSEAGFQAAAATGRLCIAAGDRESFQRSAGFPAPGGKRPLRAQQTKRTDTTGNGARKLPIRFVNGDARPVAGLRRHHPVARTSLSKTAAC